MKWLTHGSVLVIISHHEANSFSLTKTERNEMKDNLTAKHSWKYNKPKVQPLKTKYKRCKKVVDTSY